jgi:hypothetical protein
MLALIFAVITVSDCEQAIVRSATSKIKKDDLKRLGVFISAHPRDMCPFVVTGRPDETAGLRRSLGLNRDATSCTLPDMPIGRRLLVRRVDVRGTRFAFCSMT